MMKGNVYMLLVFITAVHDSVRALTSLETSMQTLPSLQHDQSLLPVLVVHACACVSASESACSCQHSWLRGVTTITLLGTVCGVGSWPLLRRCRCAQCLQDFLPQCLQGPVVLAGNVAAAVSCTAVPV